MGREAKARLALSVALREGCAVPLAVPCRAKDVDDGGTRLGIDDAGGHVALTRLPMRLPCGEQEEQGEEAPKESGRVVVVSHSGIGKWERGFYSSSIGL